MIKLGYNLVASSLTPVNYHANMMRGSGGWTGGDNSDQLIQTPDGWLVSGTIPEGHNRSINCEIKNGETIPGIPEGSPACVLGDYTVVIDADQHFDINLQQYENTSLALKSTGTTKDGRRTKVYTIGTAHGAKYPNGFTCQAVAYASNQTLRSVAIYPPGVDPENPPPFDPWFIKSCKGIKVARCNFVNGCFGTLELPAEFQDKYGWPNATQRTYADTRDYPGKIPGWPPRDCAILANELGLEVLWIGLPVHTGSDARKRFIREIMAELKPGIKLAVELGDETAWNSFGPVWGKQWNYVDAIGRSREDMRIPAYPPFPNNNGAIDPDKSTWTQGGAQSATAFLSGELYADAEAVMREFGREKDLIRVLGSFGMLPDVTEGMLRCCMAYGARPDWVAVTFYDGILPEDSPQFTMPGAGMSAADVLAAGLASVRKHRAAATTVEHIKRINRQIELHPDKFGPAKLVGYEGGFNGCYFSNDLPEETRVRQALSLRYNPGFAEITRELLQSCSDAGMEYLCMYSHSHFPVKEGGGHPMHGVWPAHGGNAANLDGTSPGYPELMKDTAGVPPGIPDLSRVGSVAAMVLQQMGGTDVATTTTALDAASADYQTNITAKVATATALDAKTKDANAAKLADDEAKAKLDASLQAVIDAAHAAYPGNPPIVPGSAVTPAHAS